MLKINNILEAHKGTTKECYSFILKDKRLIAVKDKQKGLNTFIKGLYKAYRGKVAPKGLYSSFI